MYCLWITSAVTLIAGLHVPFYVQEYFADGARIEAAFRKYFHRASPSQTEDSHELLVCHGNVISYFTCRWTTYQRLCTCQTLCSEFNAVGSFNMVSRRSPGMTIFPWYPELESSLHLKVSNIWCPVLSAVYRSCWRMFQAPIGSRVRWDRGTSGESYSGFCVVWYLAPAARLMLITAVKSLRTYHYLLTFQNCFFVAVIVTSW